jgi:hypothetical protein
VTLLSLHDERVRRLLDELPVHAPGQPIYAVIVPDVSDKVSGFWSLWRIRPSSRDDRYQRIIPVFISDEGRQFAPTAERIWGIVEYFTELEMAKPQAGGAALVDQEGKEYPYAAPVTGAAALQVYQASRQAAEAQGASLYAELTNLYQQGAKRQLERAFASYLACGAAIKNFEPEATYDQQAEHNHRQFHSLYPDLTHRETSVPELTALLLLRVERESPA